MGAFLLAKNFAMAGVPGLEPRLNEPESLVLPITPYPMAQSAQAKTQGGDKRKEYSNALQMPNRRHVALIIFDHHAPAIRYQSDAQPSRLRKACRRFNTLSRPKISMDSNSGGETWRPVTATRIGPKATRGLISIPSTISSRRACSRASVVKGPS